MSIRTFLTKTKPSHYRPHKTCFVLVWCLLSLPAFAAGIEPTATLTPEPTATATTEPTAQEKPSDQAAPSAEKTRLAQTPETIEPTPPPKPASKPNVIHAPMSKLFPRDLFPPNDSQYDWVQLNSQELLKGEIKYLYADTLEFESDELDTLFIDWEDIKILQSSNNVSLGLKGRKSSVGRILIIDNLVYINGTTMPREDVLTIIAGDINERNFWTVKASLGSTLQRGNNSQWDLSTQIAVNRRTTLTRLSSDYLANYSENSTETLINNQRLTANFDWFVADSFFLRPLTFQYRSDPFQNIDRETILGFGIGYDILDTGKIDWTVSGGPGYKTTEFEDVPESDPKRVRFGTSTFESKFEYEVFKDIDFTSRYTAQFSNSASGGYTHHTNTSLEIEVTDIIDVKFSYVWDRNNNPTSTSDGLTPLKDDHQYILSLGLDI